MSLVRKAPRSAIVVRAVAFGTPDGSVWGAGVDAGVPALVAGAGAEPVAATVDWNADSSEWGLSGERVSLTVSPAVLPAPLAAAAPASPGVPAAAAAAAVPTTPANPPAVSPAATPGPVAPGSEPQPRAGDDPPQSPVAAERKLAWSGRQELCRVTGTLDDAEIDCVGVRTELTHVRRGELGSIRGFSGWVSAEEAVTLLALRPPTEAHHERDLVAATVFEPDRWMSSHDPRLSTTYDGDGNPNRATLELWISEGEREFARRAAGEAAGPAVAIARDDVTLRVLPLRCHSRGSDGAGVYLLANV
jgi:hypothetical protein